MCWYCHTTWSICQFTSQGMRTPVTSVVRAVLNTEAKVLIKKSIESIVKVIDWRKEMFYLMMHSPHFIYGYMVVKGHLDSERGNPLPPHGLLLLINSKGSFICIIPQTYHSLCYTSRGALAGTRNSSMGPLWRIDPTTHRIMSVHSYQSYILLPNKWIQTWKPKLNADWCRNVKIFSVHCVYLYVFISFSGH